MAALGWVAGTICMAGFALIVGFLTWLLARATVTKGRRNRTYFEAVEAVLGTRHAGIVTAVQLVYVISSDISYIIVSAISLQTIEGELNSGATSHKPWFWAIIVGIIQEPLSCVPTLESSWVGSFIGAVLSMVYSAIAIYLGITNWSLDGSVGGTSVPAVDKVFDIFTALGNIMFAVRTSCRFWWTGVFSTFCQQYANSCLLMEISATLKEPVLKNTRKAVVTSNITFFTCVVSAHVSQVSLVPPFQTFQQGVCSRRNQ